ncbi:MAG TPA: hypothetical protein VFX16_28780 [Pseudonocardiaceae bacterium]|nr:hypothetical protein [Pseudonocardiaceae bacterium]
MVEAIDPPSNVLQGEEDQQSFSDIFIGMMRAYIAEDIQYVWTLVPGAPRLSTPEIPAESPGSTGNWLTSIRSIIFVPPRTYRIVVTRLESEPLRVAVQVLKKPGNGVIAAATFQAITTDELVTKVGGYCVEQVQQQRRILRRTPRWEQWANRGGYAHFREALVLERTGDQKKALEKYRMAGSLSLGNVTIALRRASILEQQKRHVEAIQVYHYTQILWPESIESTYRYAAACSNLRDPTLQSYVEANRSLEEIRQRLRRHALTGLYLRTWLPNRRNSGERAYWLSWLRPWRFEHIGPFTRRTKRRDFSYAIDVAVHVVAIVEHTQAKKLPNQGKLPDTRSISLQHHLTAVQRLLSHKRIGWLAHYNGACFYSLCSQLNPNCFSSDLTDDEWKQHQIDCALKELGTILRDPLNELDPAWVLIDPDMEGLRDSATANHWATFLGIRFDEKDSTMGTRVYRRADPIR